MSAPRTAFVTFALLLAVALSGAPAGCTRPNPDFQAEPIPSGPCQAGTRSCSGQTSLVCIEGSYQTDRTCPAGTTCAQGSCNPGTAATRCADDRACPAGTSCTVFIDPLAPAVLSTFCSAPVGSVGAGGRCQSNQECQSGLCLGARSSASCFMACSSMDDCPAPLKCAEVSVTVEGVRDQKRLKACVERR